MKHSFVFNYILGENTDGTRWECTTDKEFSELLSKQKDKIFLKIYIAYQIDNKQYVYVLERPDENSQWSVLLNDEPPFDFSCKEISTIIKDFELILKEKFADKNPYSFPTPDYDAQVSI